MTNKIEVKGTFGGTIGFIHEVELNPDTVLIFQLPRETKMLSNSYVEGALKAAREALPPGRKAVVVGADVNVYELCGQDAIALKLKGLL